MDIEVRFFNQLIFHLSQLGRFIDQIETQKSHRRADIVFFGRAVSITFTRPEAHARLTLQITCEQLDWQLSSIAQICDHFFPFLSSVQDLVIDTTQRSSEKDDADDEQWLELIRAFDGAEDFRVAVELATNILRALRPVDGEHTTVLPSLRSLSIPGLMSIPRPLRRAVESFTALRRLSGHHVQVYPLSLSPARFLCSSCDVRFATQQGLNRHNKDMHTPRQVCPHCGIFTWSPARWYLFTKHLARSHPQVVHLS